MVGRSRWGRTCDGGAGLCRKTHGLSLLRGPVSTALTSTSPASVRPAGIVEILRFLFGVQRRYAFNVSTMDTSDLPGPARPLPFGPALTSKTTSLPKVPARASVSEVMTPTCLPREETAHETHRP